MQVSLVTCMQSLLDVKVTIGYPGYHWRGIPVSLVSCMQPLLEFKVTTGYHRLPWLSRLPGIPESSVSCIQPLLEVKVTTGYHSVDTRVTRVTSIISIMHANIGLPPVTTGYQNYQYRTFNYSEPLLEVKVTTASSTMTTDVHYNGQCTDSWVSWLLYHTVGCSFFAGYEFHGFQVFWWTIVKFVSLKFRLHHMIVYNNNRSAPRVSGDIQVLH